MKLCKKCVICGHVNIYSYSEIEPDSCEKCDSSLAFAYEEKYDEGLEERESEVESSQDPPKEPSCVKTAFYLISADGKVKIPVTTEAVTIGRMNSGKEYLRNYCDVSRIHMTVQNHRNICVVINDCGSKFGTFVNGKKVSGRATAAVNSTIRLAEKAEFTVKKGE